MAFIIKLAIFTEKEEIIESEDEKVENEPTSCLRWALDIDQDIKNHIDKDGEDDNAHLNMELGNKLVRHCATIPLWTCVSRNSFGFGRRPASTAPVEQEFNDLKNRVFKGNLLLRVDEFVERHTAHIHERNLLIVSNDQKNKKTDKKQPLLLDSKDNSDCAIAIEDSKSNDVSTVEDISINDDILDIQMSKVFNKE